MARDNAFPRRMGFAVGAASAALTLSAAAIIGTWTGVVHLGGPTQNASMTRAADAAPASAQVVTPAAADGSGPAPSEPAQDLAPLPADPNAAENEVVAWAERAPSEHRHRAHEHRGEEREENDDE